MASQSGAPWTPELDDQLYTLLFVDGLTQLEASKRLGRTEGSVAGRACRKGWVARVGAVQPDYERLALFRRQGLTWPEIGKEMGWTDRMMRRQRDAYRDHVVLTPGSPSSADADRENAMIERVRADGGYPRVERVHGRSVYVYAYERRAA